MNDKRELPLYRKVWDVLTPRERWRVVVQLLLSMVGMMLEALGIGMVVPAMMLVTTADPGARYPVIQPFLDWLGNPTQTQLVVGGMLSLAIVYIVKSVFLGFLAWSQNRFAYSVMRRLSEQLLTTYLAQPYIFHLQRNSAFLIRNTAADVQYIAQGALRPLMTLFTESLMLTAICALLLIAEPIGALAVVGVVAPAAWGFYVFTRERVALWGRQRREHDGLRSMHLMQSYSGVKEIKLLGREDEFVRRYRYNNKLAAKAAEIQATVSQLPRLGLELLAVLGLVVLVLTMLLQGRDLANVIPILGVFAAAAFRLLPSIVKILASAQSIRFALPAIRSLYPELKLSIPPRPQKRGERYPLKTEIELKEVSFSYPGASHPALQDVSLTIRKGESVGFIGTSGSGKSTLVNILLGMERISRTICGNGRISSAMCHSPYI
jgi:ABC-type multidrug transport system fused ATPase/permease subunit